MSTPTLSLYYQDDYRREMEAQLVAINGADVVLDQTVFYPRGGNQASDKGTLSLIDSDDILLVPEVSKDDAGLIHHHLTDAPGDGWEPGAHVHGQLDWERRISLMRLHTAQHMISRWYLDQQSNETTRVDITKTGCAVEFARPISLESALECVGAMNSIIAGGRPVRRLDTDGYIEIIVEDFDRQPCGGTHVGDVAEIGRVALVRHKGNRIDIVAGPDALETERIMAASVLGLLADLATDVPDFAPRVARLVAESRAARSELHSLREEAARHRISVAAAGITPDKPVPVDLPMVESKVLPRLLKAAQGPGRVFVCLLAGRNLSIISGSANLPANILVDRAKARWSLSGGGSPAVAMCGPLPDGVTLDEVLQVVSGAAPA